MTPLEEWLAAGVFISITALIWQDHRHRTHARAVLWLWENQTGRNKEVTQILGMLSKRQSVQEQIIRMACGNFADRLGSDIPDESSPEEVENNPPDDMH